jgi:drug/metabolite transporter (DMT)-like permease
MSKKSLGFLALVAAAVIYSTFGIWMRLLGNELGAYQTTALANIFAAIISLVIVLIQKKKIILEKNLNYKNLSLFILVVPAAIIFYNFSVMNTKLATATFALYAASFIVSFLVGRLIFKEKISKLKVIALLIAFVGLSFLSFPFSFNFGFLMGLASGVADTFANSLKKDLSGKIERMFLVLVSRVAAVVVSLVVVVATGEELIIFSALPIKTYLIAFVFGIFFVGVIYLTIIGFQYSDVSVGTIVLSSELFFAPIVAFLVFREIPIATEIIGGFLILVAMVLPNLNLFKKKVAS